MQNKTTNWQEAFKALQTYTQHVNAIADRVNKARHEEGWKLAATVGIPRCGCSLHNASIDTDLTGWCKDNPQRLKVAKQANYIVNDWTASRLAEAAIKRAWNRFMVPMGAPKQD